MRRLARPAVWLVLLLVAVAGVTQQLPAQNSVSTATIDTGTVDEGRRAGRDAASKISVDRFGIAFGGGGLIGVFGPFVFQDDARGPIGLIAGLTMIGAVWKWRDNRPATQSINERGEGYRRAYTESYEKRLGQRRRNAALIGGVAGMVVGFGTLLLTSMLIGSTY